jgi:hypothetical protein
VTFQNARDPHGRPCPGFKELHPEVERDVQLALKLQARGVEAFPGDLGNSLQVAN